MGIDSATQDDQDQHHDHCNGDQAAAPAAVPTATTTGRASEIAVERRHVLGIAASTATGQQERSISWPKLLTPLPSIPASPATPARARASVFRQLERETIFDGMPARSHEKGQALLHKL